MCVIQARDLRGKENSKIITTNNRMAKDVAYEAGILIWNQHGLNRDDGSYLPQEYLTLLGK